MHSFFYLNVVLRERLQAKMRLYVSVRRLSTRRWCIFSLCSSSHWSLSSYSTTSWWRRFETLVESAIRGGQAVEATATRSSRRTAVPRTRSRECWSLSYLSSSSVRVRLSSRRPCPPSFPNRRCTVRSPISTTCASVICLSSPTRRWTSSFTASAADAFAASLSHSSAVRQDSRCSCCLPIEKEDEDERRRMLMTEDQRCMAAGASAKKKTREGEYAHLLLRFDIETLNPVNSFAAAVD